MVAARERRDWKERTVESAESRAWYTVGCFIEGEGEKGDDGRKSS